MSISFLSTISIIIIVTKLLSYFDTNISFRLVANVYFSYPRCRVRLLGNIHEGARVRGRGFHTPSYKTIVFPSISFIKILVVSLINCMFSCTQRACFNTFRACEMAYVQCLLGNFCFKYIPSCNSPEEETVS